MSYYFATLFDQNYLARGLSLINSLDRVLPNAYSLYILALDQDVIEYFDINKRPNIVILTLNQLETFYPELTTAKNNRNKVEYYFTLSPILPLYILENFKQCHRITTVDSDIYFYASPAIIFDHYTENAILITPHDFSEELQNLSKFGKYNVSFQSFPNTINGLAVLKNWKDKCISWCFDNIEEKTGYYADQKYLDEWESNFEDIAPITLKTCGRAPWNISNTTINYLNGNFEINGQLLIYYHFHGLRINNRCVNLGLQVYNINDIPDTIKYVYSRYILSIYNFNKKVNLRSDKNVARIELSSNSNNIFRFIFHNESGAIILSSKKVLFFNLKIRTNLIRLRNYLSGRINRS